MIRHALVPAALAALQLASAPADAAPAKVVIFGGGWGPEGTQASIEGHVAALEAGLQNPDTLLFAAGGGPRSVQVLAPRPDPNSAVLGLVFDRRDNLGVDYRQTELSGAGRASKQAVLRALHRARGAGDVIVFGAGHGAPATEDLPAALELWGPDDRLDVVELAEALDRPSGHQAAFVLGQCHSGAFTDVMFVGADPEVGLAAPTRCVFAAVPAEREAAGCTPDVNDPGARAYVAAIAQALTQREQADADGDGALSLAEVDAYARIVDGTVDVPVKTSDVWLDLRLGDRAPDIRRWSTEALLRAAAPPERAVLKGALPKASLRAGPDGIRRAHAHLDKLIRALDEHIRDVADRRETVRRTLVDAVLLRWPELANPYHAEARRLLAGDAAEVVGFLRARRELSMLQSLDVSITALDAQLLDLQRQAARLERWLRAAQHVANAAALRRRGDEALIGGLEALQRCEAMVVAE